MQILDQGPLIPGTTGTYPSRIVLRKNEDNKVTPFITHLEVLPDGRDAAGTTPYYVWGHYFADEDSARKDFAERLSRGY